METKERQTSTYDGVSSDRLIVQQRARGLEITVLHDRSWGSIFLTGFWLLGWTVGELVAAAALLLIPFSAKPDKWMALIFVFGWLCAWSAGGYFVWRRFLWELVGKEKILINGRRLIVGQQVPIFGRMKEFFHANIHNVRLRPAARRVFMSGRIAFDYGDKEYTLGVGLREKDESDLLRLLRERFRNRDSTQPLLLSLVIHGRSPLAGTPLGIVSSSCTHSVVCSS
jgi:hypothetical protein